MGSAFNGEEPLYSSSLKMLKLKTRTSSLKDGVNLLLKTAEMICLESMNDLKNVLHSLDGDRFLNLRCIDINKCRNMIYVVDTWESAPCVVFPLLEISEMRDLENLQEISHGRRLEGSFGQLQELRLHYLPELLNICRSPSENVPLRMLRVLTIYGCHKLKTIFSHSMVRNICELLEMRVCVCKALDDIVNGEEREEINAIMFPRLRIVDLACLPELKSVFSLVSPLAESTEIVFPQLRMLELQRLPKIRSFISLGSSVADCIDLGTRLQEALFNNKVVFPNLERMSISHVENVMEIWATPFKPEVTLPRLMELSISDLQKLKHLWSGDLYEAAGFPSLSSLTLNSCPVMKVIAAMEENVTGFPEFPCLQTLKLSEISNLRSFFTGRHALCDEKVGFPRLKELCLCELPKLMHVWQYMDPFGTQVSFQTLRQLEIRRCDNLTSVLSCNNNRCTVVREEREKGAKMIVFPGLQFIQLSDLPKLMSFFTGNYTLFDEMVGRKNRDDCFPWFAIS